MHAPPYNVLILCTGNSARSILGEALVNHLGDGRFVGFSAGSRPKDGPNPLALELLRHMQLPTAGLRSKSWDEFSRPGAPSLDFVFTVCDGAASEACPVWPGAPVRAHWGIDDPASVEGPESVKRSAFRKTFHELESRIRIFTGLPIETFDAAQLQHKVSEIGRMT